MDRDRRRGRHGAARAPRPSAGWRAPRSRRSWCSSSALGSSFTPRASTASRARSTGSDPPRHHAAGAARGGRGQRRVANLLNNLPATLIILPGGRRTGPGTVLAMLVGVNVGPNLTYVGSLATLLWRRIVARSRRGDRHGRVHAPRDCCTVPARCLPCDGRVVVGSAGRLMRAVVWISEDTWEACVDQARAFLPEDADVTLLHVAPTRRRGARFARGPARLLGRHPPPPPPAEPPLRADRRGGGPGAARRGAGPPRAAGADRVAARASRARGARGVRRRRLARPSSRRRGSTRSQEPRPRTRDSPSTTRPARCCSCGPKLRPGSRPSRRRHTITEALRPPGPRSSGVPDRRRRRSGRRRRGPQITRRAPRR